MCHEKWTATRTLLRVPGRLVMMAVALALPLLVPSAAAPKRGPSSFVGGVAAGPLLNHAKVNYPRQLDTMVSGGVQTLRTSFNWSGVQPYESFDDVPAGERGRSRNEHGVPTDYTYTDHLVGTAAARRMRVLP